LKTHFSCDSRPSCLAAAEERRGQQRNPDGLADGRRIRAAMVEELAETTRAELQPKLAPTAAEIASMTARQALRNAPARAGRRWRRKNSRPDRQPG